MGWGGREGAKVLHFPYMKSIYIYEKVYLKVLPQNNRDVPDVGAERCFSIAVHEQLKWK